MLRAVISEDGEQRILRSVPPYEVNEVNLTEATADAIARHVGFVRDECSHEVRPADQWPLFELRITRLPGGTALLHGSLDMLVMDVTSIQLLVSELTLLYGDPAHDLPPLDVTFRDYILAEARLEETELYDKSKTYWMDRLPSLPAAPGLPQERSPAALDRQVFVRRSHTVSAESWARIKTRAAAAGVTPSMVVLSAYAQVLAYWSTNSSFVVNVTVSNRLPMHPQVDALIGDFTTVELLEVDLGERRGLRQLASALQSQLWQDLEHRYFSGIRVLRELARMRGEGVLLAPVVFTSALGTNLTEMSAATYAISQTPQVLLDHQAFEIAGELVLHWDSVDEVFPPGMLDDMFGAYSRYMEAIVDDDGLWDDV